MKIFIIVSLLLFQLLVSHSSTAPADQPTQKTCNAGTANLVFKSTDGGQTWQDISQGLQDLAKDEDDIGRYDFFANDNGFWLTDGNGLFHNKPSNAAPFWTKEILPDERNRIAAGKTAVYAYNYSDRILQKTNGADTWSPVYTNFKYDKLRSIIETAEGTLFIGSDYGLFKSVDGGKNWKQVNKGFVPGKLVESNGVLIATSNRGIIRSIDGGENWEQVISEGGVGIDVACINGGFAAITYCAVFNARRIRTSYDGGKTWQLIDAGLPADLSTASIIEVDGNFFCGHPKGIYRSTDKGKTWKLLFPSVNGKVFNLSSSGNVIYAVPRSGGC